MAKVDLELVKMVLTREKLGTVEIARIIEDIQKESRLAKNDGEKEPAVKKQYAFILSDPQGRFKGDTDYVGWVVQIPEDDDASSAVEKLQLGAHDFNRSVKGRRYPVKTMAEACEFGSAKLFKEQKIWIKTKNPVLVLRSDNKLPAE